MTPRNSFHKSVSLSALLVLSVLAQPRGATAQSIATGQHYAGFDIGITGTELLGNQNFLWRLYPPDDPTLQTYLPFSKLGSGIGVLGGFKIGVAASEAVDIETKLRLQTHYTSRQESFTNLVLDHYYPNVRTDGVSNYSLTQTSADLGLFVHYRLSDHFYAIAGADYATFLANNLALHQKITIDHGYIRTDAHNSSNIDTLDRPSSELLGYLAQVRGSIQLGVGTVVRPGTSNSLLDAELLLSIPFTEWMSNLGKSQLDATAANFQQPAITYPKMWYVSLTIGLRLPFKKLPAAEIEDANAHENSSVLVTMQQTNDTSAGAAVGATGGATLSGSVTNARTGAAVGATLTAVDLATNEIVGTTQTEPDGTYHVHVFGPGKYSITAEAPGYLFGTADFEVDAEGRILKHHSNITLSEASNGRTRLLVFFEFGKAELHRSSIPELMRAVLIMKAIPAMRVEIAGYTDSVGTLGYNQDLSLRRADAVRNFLVEHGVDPSRVTSHGYGPESPIAPNDTDEGRSENRRVEFVVAGK
jgi:outer membrane protein OmpA-like peptidoglycan-associated protein